MITSRKDFIAFGCCLTIATIGKLVMHNDLVLAKATPSKIPSKTLFVTTHHDIVSPVSHQDTRAYFPYQPTP